MRFIAGLLALVCVVAATPSRAAETFPDRPIHIVVPYVPGVGADIAARVLAERLQDIFHVAVVVDNKPGASGAIGAAAVIHSAPDGYNVLITGESLYSVYMQASPTYDPLKDITPVAQVIGLPYAFLARKSFPATTWAEFVAYAKAHPGKVTAAIPGYGTPHHVLTEVLMRALGLDLYQVPGASNVQDVMSDRLDVAFQPVSVATRMLPLGVKALAAGGEHRAAEIPGAPSFAELGVDALRNSNSVNGIFVANGTPPEIVARLAAGFHEALEDHAVAEKLENAGFVVDFLDARAYAAKVRDTAARWETILRDARDRDAKAGKN